MSFYLRLGLWNQITKLFYALYISAMHIAYPAHLITLIIFNEAVNYEAPRVILLLFL